MDDESFHHDLAFAAVTARGAGNHSLANLLNEAAVRLTEAASRCVLGVPCERHRGVVHGREAEELRAGLEKILSDSVHRSSGPAAHKELRLSLQRLLDKVNARDSLAFLEAADPKLSVPQGA